MQHDTPGCKDSCHCIEEADINTLHLQDRLIGLVAGYLLDSNNSERLACMDEAHRVNTQRNIEDAIQQLPKLATGVDVNVGFTSIDAFEFTQETVIFDLLDVRLLHGWLVDPQVNRL